MQGKERKPNQSTDLSQYVFGKTQPQAIPLEEAVLGAIMLDRDAVSIVIDILKPESFYLESHQEIYSAFLRLFEKSHPIDLLTTTESLNKSGKLECIGGPHYLVELTNRVASAANIEHHARIIEQKAIQRGLIKISCDTIRDAYSDSEDAFEILDSHERKIFDLAKNSLTGTVTHVSQSVTESWKKLEKASQTKDGITGVPSGFVDIDKLTNGYQPGNLIIIAGRPGMGKTSFVLAITKNVSFDFNKPVVFFSLEMSKVELVDRLVSMDAEIEGSKIRSGRLQQCEWQNIHSSYERISAAPIFIDDTPGINIFEIRAKCRRLKMRHDIQLVIIDYLQLMGGADDGKKGNREQEISAITRSLKGLAKDLGVPIIALSQLSRAVETRGGSKKPMLSDLRESGSIEQDADIVQFIYRPEYYEIIEDDEGNSLIGISEIITSKHRNGALKTIKLRFTDRFAKFTDMDDPGHLKDDKFAFESGNNLIKRQNGTQDDLPF
jgi:replicative DNA helicase